jgi:transposase
MGSTRRLFTPEYKANAVQFVLDEGRSIAEVAKNIGCSSTALGIWVKKAKAERGDSEPKTLSISEREELEELRSENRELRMQLEFAKKVAIHSIRQGNGA